MPIENFGLREMVQAAISDAITVYLHTANPGTNGMTARVTALTTAAPTITATTGWTLHGTQGRAEVASDVSFGNATQAIPGVSWYSLFKGGSFYARRALASSMNIANGAPVTLTGSTIVIEVTSSDS